MNAVVLCRMASNARTVTLQRGNAAFIRKDNCIPKSAAAQGDLDAEDAGAAALEGA